MEALFCSFNVGNGGGGVIGGCFGGLLGCLAVSWTCGCGQPVLTNEKKKPLILMAVGHGGEHEGSRRLVGVLVRLPRCLADVFSVGGGCFVARVWRTKKNPVNVNQGVVCCHQGCP